MQTSCQKHTSQAVQRFSAKETSASCSAAGGRAAPDQFKRSTFGWRSSCTSTAPALSLSRFGFFFFTHWTILWEKVINHNYLRRWQSPSHSSAHSPPATPPHPTPPHPSVPRCPPVLSLCFPCSTLQEINVAVRPFIYLECCHRWEGHRKPRLPPPTQIWPGSVNFQRRVRYWQWQAATDTSGQRLVQQSQSLLPSCQWLPDPIRDGADCHDWALCIRIVLNNCF